MAGIRFPNDMIGKSLPIAIEDKMLIADSMENKKAKWLSFETFKDWISGLFASKTGDNLTASDINAWQSILDVALLKSKINNAAGIDIYTLGNNGWYATDATTINLPTTNKIGVLQVIVNGNSTYLYYKTWNGGLENWHTYNDGTGFKLWSRFSGVHNDLSGRDAADTHPIAAITGLETALTVILDWIDAADLTRIEDADGDTYVTTEETADGDRIVAQANALGVDVIQEWRNGAGDVIATLYADYTIEISDGHPNYASKLKISNIELDTNAGAGGVITAGQNSKFQLPKNNGTKTFEFTVQSSFDPIISATNNFVGAGEVGTILFGIDNIAFEIAQRNNLYKIINATGFVSQMPILQIGNSDTCHQFMYGTTAILRGSDYNGAYDKHAGDVKLIAGTNNSTHIGTSIGIRAGNAVVEAGEFNGSDTAGKDGVVKIATNRCYAGVGTGKPICKLDTNGSRATSITKKTADYTIVNGDSTIIADPAANMTITLPPAADCFNTVASTGIIFTIKRVSGISWYIVTVAAASGELIDSTASINISTGDAIDVQSDGTEWYVIRL